MKDIEIVYKNKIFICENQKHISRLISKSFGEYNAYYNHSDANVFIITGFWPVHADYGHDFIYSG